MSDKKKMMWAQLEPLLHASIEAGLDRELVREFIGISVGTFNHLLKKDGPKRLLMAHSLLKLWFFFDMLKKDMPPLRDPTVQNAEYTDFVARAVAFGVIPPETANELCGLSGGVQHVWLHLRGESITTKPALTVKDLKDLYGSALEKEYMDWENRIERSLREHSEDVTKNSSSTKEVDEQFETTPFEVDANDVNDPEPDTESVSDLHLEPDPEPEPAMETEPQNVITLPQKALNKLSELRPVPEKVLPVDVLLTIAGSLSAVLPHIRHMASQFDTELIEEWLNEYFGADAATDIVEFLGYSLSQEEAEEAVLDVVESGDVVKRTAKALRQLAPDINVLFEDDTSEGALARERLRNEVGPELYGSLTVKLNSMRSFRVYEKARNGDVN